MKPSVLIPLCGLLFVLTFIVAWVLPDASQRQQAERERGFFGPAVADASEALALTRRVRALTIQHYDHEQAFLHQFSISQQNGQWIIPSHHNYPADGADQVGRTAGSILGLERRSEARVSSDPRDHSRLGVLDPQDEQAPFGIPRGKRVTLTGGEGETILDLIIGNEVEDRMGWYYVRQADEDGVYQVEFEPVLSTRFTDYVNRDLLQMSRSEISEVVIDPHRVDIEAGSVTNPPKVTLRRQGSSQLWTSAQAPLDHSVDAEAIRRLLDGITGVRLQGVRPLQPLSMARMARFGFFTNDGATIWGYEGALEIQRNNGLRYTLYFGGRAPDEGLALSAGMGDDDGIAPQGSNRFMIILVNYKDDADADIRRQENDLRAEAEDALAEGESLSEEAEAALATRIADWLRGHIAGRHQLRDEEQARVLEFFYVISGNVFDSLRPDIDALFSATDAETQEARGSDPDAIAPIP